MDGVSIVIGMVTGLITGGIIGFFFGRQKAAQPVDLSGQSAVLANLNSQNPSAATPLSLTPLS